MTVTVRPRRSWLFASAWTRQIGTLRSIPVLLGVSAAWPAWLAGLGVVILWFIGGSTITPWYVAALVIVGAGVVVTVLDALVTTLVALVAQRVGVRSSDLVIRVPRAKRLNAKAVPSGQGLIAVGASQILVRALLGAASWAASALFSGAPERTLELAAWVMAVMMIADSLPVFWSAGGWVIKGVAWSRSGSERQGASIAALATFQFGRLLMWVALGASLLVSGWMLLLAVPGAVVRSFGKRRMRRLAAGIDEDQLAQLLGSLFRVAAAGGRGPRSGASGEPDFGSSGFAAPGFGSERAPSRQRLRVDPIDVRIVDDRSELNSDTP